MKINVFSILLVSSVVFLTACGGGNDNDESSSTTYNVDINNIQNPVVGTPTTYKFHEDAPPNAADSVVMTYKMKGVKGSETLATSLIFTPKTAPPAGGWPIVAWAHGATGVADKCAPSENKLTTEGVFGPGDPTIKNMIDSFLKEGYVVVAPNYEGLGEPSGNELHPFLNVRSEAYSITDAVVATKNWLGNKVSNKWAVIGHSQGGNAALGAAQYAARANMDYKGTVAVAPASNLKLIDSLIELSLQRLPDELFDAEGNADPESQRKILGYVTTDAFVSLIAASIKATSGIDGVYSKIFRSPTDQLAQQAESECLLNLGFVFLNGMGEYSVANNFSIKGYPRRTANYLDDPIVKQFLERDSQPLQVVVKTPIIIYQGGADTLVLPQATDALVTQARALTTKIDYRTDPKWDHVTAYSINVENGNLLTDIKKLLSN
ncbi:alpha/beta fold hydrolase [Acinetobacter guillouiae]|uniref:alpha/beta hydrolase family protein n=1 Tax=Acinetobacter guillouiae TaxID=106649 RepID=UPI0021D0FE68|nr:prolyl oligopeptidase family serine peptidase [Acinetobacter guillouiae]MCU4492258.1 alpha/beta fold hydrolase [Acinetobacter guillouiae]